MSWQDPAALALRPLIDLTADPVVAPAAVAEAALFWSAQTDPAGWAPIHAPPPDFRDLMRRAELVDGLDELIAPTPVRQRLDATDPADLLWSARLMRQLGRRDAAVKLLVRIGEDAPPPVRAWRELLLASNGQATPPPLSNVEAGHAVRFATAIACAEWEWRIGQPPNGPLAEAEAVASAIEAADAELGAVARARMLAAALRFQAGPTPSIKTIRAATGQHSPDDIGFLLRDARLALLHAAVHSALSESHVEQAVELATTALALDPTGAATHLLAGAATRAAGEVDRARGHYRDAVRFGLFERSAALAGLVDLAVTPDGDTSLVGAVADLLSHDPGHETARLRLLADRHPALIGTVAADAVRWATRVLSRDADTGTAEPSTMDGHRTARRPLVLERYRPFLDLRPSDVLDPVDAPPVAIHTPLMSYAAVLERREPWFREIHPQRATAAMFRDEMQATAAVYGYRSGAVSAGYQTWLAAADGCPAPIRAMLENADDLPLLGRALLGRLLSAVGFHAQAKQLLPGPDVPVRSPEEAYALASWLFAEQMLTTGRAAELDPHFRLLYSQLGDDIRYARLKVVTSINATVNAARRREPHTIAYWRELGGPALTAYTGLDEVDEFDAAVMTSRWYRAMGFLPFLTGDKDLLRSDMDQWLGVAQELTGHDEHTRVIAADNYFPAVETAIRTHTYLGEHDIALSMVDKLAVEIDPIDPKTWLTAGELRYQAGDVTGALAAYERAAHLQFPYGRLSWFNAGQCHEMLGHPDEAAECYRRSLAHWPTGVTPLRRLRDMQLKGQLAADHGLLAAWASGQPAWSKLPPYEG
jgi:tetratricopeptide (TPR) repeat protein